MHIPTKIRKTVTALGLTAIGVSAAASTAMPAQALSLPPGSITTAKVTILDYENIDHSAWMPDPTQTGGGFQQFVANPDVFVNPPRIHANDRVAACVTFNNPGFTKTSPTPYSITGPSYNLTGTVPALARNTPTTLCSGYFRLNFPAASACSITLTAKPQGYAAKSSRKFTQADPRCPTPISRSYEMLIGDNGNHALVLDFNNVNNADTSDNRFINPYQIHANDNVNVCTTFADPGYGATTTTPVTVTGPNYSATTTAHVLAAGQPQTVCTGYYHLNWQGAFPAPNADPVPCGIQLQATVGYRAGLFSPPLAIGSTRIFSQAGLMCPGTPVPPIN